MPIVPRARPTVPQIGSLPQVRNTVRVEQAPSALAALSPLAQGIGEFYEQEKRRNDVTALMQARRELSDFESSVFDPENPEGITAYRGKNALVANDKLIPTLDQRVSQIGERLTPDQRAQFDMIALNFRDSLQGRLNQHMSREHEAFLQAEQKATVLNLTNDAATAAAEGNLGLAASRASELLAMRRASLEAEGMPEELIKAEERNTVSTIHSQAVASMVVRDPLQAQAYLDRYADQFSAVDRANAERLVQPFAEDAAAEAIAGDALAGVDSGPLLSGEGDYATMRRRLESAGGNPRAYNKASGAAGPDQFLAKTWLGLVKDTGPAWARGLTEAQILEKRFDPEISGQMAEEFDRRNAAGLERRGLPVNNTTLYLAHHFGEAGGAAIIRAPADTPMQRLVTPAAYKANPHLHGKTKAQMLADFQRRSKGAMGAVDGGASVQVVAVAPPQTEGEALELVRNDPRTRDPRVRQAAEQKVRQQWSQREQDRQDADRLREQQIHTMIEEGDPRQNIRAILGPQFGYAASRGLVKGLEDRLEQRRRGELVQDNVELADTLRRQSIENPAGFAKLPLAKYAGQLSTETLEDLTERQATIAKPDKKAEFANEEEQLKALVYGPLGLSGTLKGPAQKRRADFDRAWYMAKRDFAARNGGKLPTPEQRDGLIRKLTATFVLNGEDTPFFAAGKRGEVPADQQALIRDAFKRAGKPAPTPDEMRFLYLQQVSK